MDNSQIVYSTKSRPDANEIVKKFKETNCKVDISSKVTSKPEYVYVQGKLKESYVEGPFHHYVLLPDEPLAHAPSPFYDHFYFKTAFPKEIQALKQHEGHAVIVKIKINLGSWKGSLDATSVDCLCNGIEKDLTLTKSSISKQLQEDRDSSQFTYTLKTREEANEIIKNFKKTHCKVNSSRQVIPTPEYVYVQGELRETQDDGTFHHYILQRGTGPASKFDPSYEDFYCKTSFPKEVQALKKVEGHDVVLKIKINLGSVKGSLKDAEVDCLCNGVEKDLTPSP